MKSTIVSLIITATALVGCTHATVATMPTEPRTPASNTGEVGSVDERDRDTTANWYRMEMAKTHMQLAARLSQARQRGLTCDTDSYQSAVIEHFTTAYGLDEKIVIQPDVVKELKNTMSYRVYQAVQQGHSRWTDTLKNLNFVGVEWASNGQGVYGSTTRLKQLANGVLEISHLDIDTLKWNKTTGKWKLGIYESKARPNKKSYRWDREVIWLTIGNRTRPFNIEREANGGFGLKRMDKVDDENSYYDYTSFENSDCDA